MELTTDISCQYDSSDKNEGIWIADWFANFIWRFYENNNNSAYNILCKHKGTIFFEKTLFASP
jgi:hypothetical protein